MASCAAQSPSIPGFRQGSAGPPGPSLFPPPPPPPVTGQEPKKEGPKADPFSVPRDPGAASYRDEFYPFDLTLDTIAYMNCPLGYPPTAFFSFKFGSYFQGLRLSESFLDSIAGGDPTVEDVRRALKTSPLVRTRARIHLSPKGDPRKAETFERENGYGSFSQSLFDHVEVISSLINRGWSRVLAGNKLIEANFPAKGENIHHITTLLGKTHVFTMTYSRGSNNKPIRKRAGVYYGRTYDVFLRGGADHNNYMEHIDEVDLLTLRRAGRWHCPESLRFVIHRHRSLVDRTWEDNEEYFEQVGDRLSLEGFCQAQPRLLTSNRKDLVERVILNRVFAVGESKAYRYGSDDNPEDARATGERCIVPKHHQYRCYDGEDYHIEFDPDERCYIKGENPKGVRRCPSYLSICVRDRRF